MTPQVHFDFAGKVALVTGAGQGIGQAFAQGFSQSGATVVATDLSVPKLQETSKLLQATGKDHLELEMDVRDAASIDRTFAQVNATLGGVDILLNNAGIRVHKPALDHTLADWEEVFGVNTYGVFLCAQAAARSMQARGGGSIINIASVYAFMPQANWIAYNASKAAVVQMTRNMAVEWGALGIRVNAIGPGVTLSPFVRQLAGSELTTKNTYTAVQRLEEPEDLVGTALYLASDASAYVTGAFIVVDGGLSLMWRFTGFGNAPERY